jgi:hypothetical protein
MIIDPGNLPMPPSGHEKWLMKLDLNHPKTALKTLPIDKPLAGSVYYPASGLDGRPVQYLGRRIQSFVYVDYLVSCDDMMAQLADADRSFLGYRLAAHRHVEPWEWAGDHPWDGVPAPCLLMKEPGTRIEEVWDHPPADQPGLARPAQSFCEWMIFERTSGFTADHGPARFSVLHLRADGVASYQALYWTRGIAPTVLCLIQPGMNWDNFRSEEGILATLVLRAGRPTPPYLVCGGQGYKCYDKAFWPIGYPHSVGYFKFELGNGLWSQQPVVAGMASTSQIQ